MWETREKVAWHSPIVPLFLCCVDWRNKCLYIFLITNIRSYEIQANYSFEINIFSFNFQSANAHFPDVYSRQECVFCPVLAFDANHLILEKGSMVPVGN